MKKSSRVAKKKGKKYGRANLNFGLAKMFIKLSEIVSNDVVHIYQYMYSLIRVLGFCN